MAYAPNGKRVYAAYSDNYSEEGNYAGSIVVSSSDNNGATWEHPAVVLAEEYTTYVSPRIATSLSESRWIYVTGTKQYGNPYADFTFTRSADMGATWSTSQILGASSHGDGVGGGTVAGGEGGVVLVTFINSDSFAGTNQVLVARSHNHGASFDAAVVAATDPWPGGFPDVRIGDKGAAHVVYRRWSGWQTDDYEDIGDIGYIWSPGPPYTTWSEPVTVNDDGAGRSQSNPSLATQKCGAFTVLHLVWEDPRLRPMADCYNDGFSHDCYWDVFYARKVAKSGAGWSKNVRVSGRSSLTGGDGALSPDVAASQGRAFAVWTDRRDKTDPSDYETDVHGSGILSGVTCP